MQPQYCLYPQIPILNALQKQAGIEGVLQNVIRVGNDFRQIRPDSLKMSRMAFFNVLNALVCNHNFIRGDVLCDASINTDVYFPDKLHVAFTAQPIVWIYYTRFRHFCNPRRIRRPFLSIDPLPAFGVLRPAQGINVAARGIVLRKVFVRVAAVHAAFAVKPHADRGAVLLSQKEEPAPCLEEAGAN